MWICLKHLKHFTHTVFFYQTFDGRLEKFGDAAKMLRVRLFRFCRRPWISESRFVKGLSLLRQAASLPAMNDSSDRDPPPRCAEGTRNLPEISRCGHRKYQLRRRNFCLGNRIRVGHREVMIGASSAAEQYGFWKTETAILHHRWGWKPSDCAGEVHNAVGICHWLTIGKFSWSEG